MFSSKHSIKQNYENKVIKQKIYKSKTNKTCASLIFVV